MTARPSPSTAPAPGRTPPRDAPAAMLPESRRDSILEIVAERGAARVGGLAAELGVSEMTIRRDLAALAARGILRRSHGGAVTRCATPEETLASAARTALLHRFQALADERIQDGAALLLRTVQALTAGPAASAGQEDAHGQPGRSPMPPAPGAASHNGGPAAGPPPGRAADGTA